MFAPQKTIGYARRPSSGPARIVKTLYHPDFERDACGFGLIARLDAEPRHDTVSDAIAALTRLTHRGAVAPDGKTGDGCGLLIGLPEAFLRREAEALGLDLGARFTVGSVFLDADDTRAAEQRKRLEQALADQGLAVPGWRVLPTDTDALGQAAQTTRPRIEQIYVTPRPGHELIDEAAFQRRLYLARRLAESACHDDETFYIASLSATTLSYKGMVMPGHLAEFYPDLTDPELRTSVALFHQRFSTNTLPQWKLAQPFRMLAHNGEINTVRGNRIWARARRAQLAGPGLEALAEIDPPVNLHGSDSSSLDNMLELLVMGGMPLPQALRILIPPAWQTADNLDADLRAFHEFFAFHQEAWDGPAGLVMTDGRWVVCGLDRNGLRPARWTLTDDARLIVASETGVVDVPVERVLARGRLGPGQLLALDLATGELQHTDEIDDRLKQLHPWQDWLKQGVRYLDSELVDVHMAAEPFDADTLASYQKMFNLSREERREVIRVLAETESEAIGSMGDDTPMPVLSTRIRSLFDCCRQQFAQVTNPAIDSLRERIVMSLETGLGRKGSPFEPSAELAERVVLNSPVLSQRKLRQLVNTPQLGLPSELLDLNYPEDVSLPEALADLCERAARAVDDGRQLLILSDRYLEPGKLPVHALLATGAVHHHLVATGQRPLTNLIVETGSARDPHHFACLIGFGATAVYPYLVYQTLQAMAASGEIDNPRDEAMQLGRAYRRGIRKGLYKILSKMGISTIGSYRGAQLFELIGLADEVVETCFPGAVSRIQGADFDDLWADQKSLARWAWNRQMPIEHGGQYRYVHGGEFHAWNPDVVTALRTAARTGEAADYRRYADLVNSREPATLRDLLRLRSEHSPIPLEQVEPASEIVKRFDSAGMSLGALSPEAHEALAIAMNRLGARSNSGEGGEDPARYGTEKSSKIKQIASGRFGVTPTYLVNAEVIQIKIAQGAKPGEGGQLPGHKVDGLIARLRFATPGVGLISPPPHHDIYSIEDLAQLIYDLKQVNPEALVSVKLVAEPGIGTIAAGVVKAYADLITVSGYDGGTGASPLTSVKYAGAPWEMGLSEVRQVLTQNGLRGQVRIQADGGLKTGVDVVKAAVLGAESFGFGTAPMIALGCKYLRICHLNNCATGIATQNQTLRREHFVGLPEMVVHYFLGVAEEVREILATLGIARLEDLVGRTEYLERLPGITGRQQKLDLEPLLAAEGLSPDDARVCCVDRNPPHDRGELASQIAADTDQAVRTGFGGRFDYAIRNHDRSIGTRLSGAISRLYGAAGMPKAIDLDLSGTAGQSLGAFNAAGVHITLTGEANDYVGKGMAGGRIVLRPPAGIRYQAHRTPIMGNTCLYGATGGELFAAGTAGERLMVRNSGAIAVVEGAGDHACEYMTGGVALILGNTGINFGAGMTGGFAYVLDLDRGFVDRYNHELIEIHRIAADQMEHHVQHLRDLIQRHVEFTGSRWGSEVLDNFRRLLPKFWLVKPKAAELDELISRLREAA
ncbi:MAG: glutamate synthase large subunit [Wenzhouxiangellaceae bacterium]|nr:glutamate synthase large subunit [Wenzhouxiangellaceae bacterium]